MNLVRLTVALVAMLLSSCGTARMIQIQHTETVPHKILDCRLDVVQAHGGAGEVLRWIEAELQKFGSESFRMGIEGYHNEVASARDPRVSLNLRDVTLRTALDTICEQAEWSYYVAPHALIIRRNRTVPEAWRKTKAWAG